MKALLTIAAAVLFAGTVLQAQTVQESKARYTVMMETRVAGGLTGNGDYEALEWTVAPGYAGQCPISDWASDITTPIRIRM